MYITFINGNRLLRYLQAAIMSLISAACISSCSQGVDTSSTLTSETLKRKGDSCMQKRDYNSAMEYYVSAVREADKQKNDSIHAAILCNIGIVYASFIDYERADYYFEKAFDKARAIGDKRIASICATNLMLLAINRKDMSGLRKWKDQKREYPMQNTDYDRFWDIYSSALLKIADNETSEARKLIAKASELAACNHWDKEHFDMLDVDIATSWFIEGNIDSAMFYYKKALSSNHGRYNQEREIFKRLNDIYRNTGQTDSLAKYQTMLLSLMDSVYNTNRFSLNKSRLMTFEEEQHHDRLFKANERFVVLLCVFVVTLVLLVIILRFYRKLRHTRRTLMEQNASLLHENEDNRKWRDRFYALEDKLNLNLSGRNDTPKIDSKEILSNAKIDNHLDAEMCQQIDIGIMRIIDDGKTLFDPDLTINSIAYMLKINSKYISWAISDIYHVNFRTFIAKHRINEACRRLASSEYDNLTIAAIAEDCGFKSVNNFIVVFKKELGMTPNKYRNASRANK